VEQQLSLIVGLGNPGAKYDKTRHNIGFDCLSELHRRMGSTPLSTKFEGQFSKGSLKGVPVILLWPLTYMNASGRCVSQLASFFRIPNDRLLVLCDDLSLPLGKLRVRKQGSSGGQKGLADILTSLGTQEICRLRVGIDTPPSNWDVADFVLSKFSADDRIVIDSAIATACDAVEHWLANGIAACMNQYNSSQSNH
jgi:peptidyl-tRNA hydrolase, PTH1 family